MTNLPSVKSKAELFMGEVLPPDRLDAIVATLPDHIKPERFRRNVYIALTQNPKLFDCEPISVFNELCKPAGLGLLFDQQLGEAYLITGWDSKANKPMPQCRIGYRGLIKLARQSGAVLNVYAHEVCANDYLELSLGTEKRLIHKPDYTKERGEIVLYYAVVEFADGSKDFEPMPIKEIERIRDRSDGWKAFKAGKIKSTPWGTDFGEMAKKTCLRRLLKRLPQSPEIADALSIEDQDYKDYAEVPARPSLADRFSASKTLPSAEGFSIEHVVRETGEIIESPSLQPELSEKPTQTSDNEEQISDPISDREAAPAAETGGEVSGDAKPPVSKELLDQYYKAMKRANKKESVQGYVIQFWKANPGIRENLSEDDLKKFATLKGLRIAAIEGTMKPEDADKEAAGVIG